MKMHANRRLQKELSDLQGSTELKYLKDLNAVDDNLLVWNCLLIPDKSSPYSNGAFRVEIIFLPEYPFKPPTIKVKTPIYHPNIGEKGEICLEILYDWKPATKAQQVISAVAALLDSPRADQPIRPEVAQEFAKDKSKFMKKARDHTSKYAEPRPSE